MKKKTVVITIADKIIHLPFAVLFCGSNLSIYSLYQIEPIHMKWSNRDEFTTYFVYLFTFFSFVWCTNHIPTRNAI